MTYITSPARKTGGSPAIANELVKLLPQDDGHLLVKVLRIRHVQYVRVQIGKEPVLAAVQRFDKSALKRVLFRHGSSSKTARTVFYLTGDSSVSPTTWENSFSAG
jgi:hypothetical protein